MYEWSRVIFAKISKFHDAGGPDTVVSPSVALKTLNAHLDEIQRNVMMSDPCCRIPGAVWVFIQ